MRTIIVDDEPAAIKNLAWELQKFSDDIKVIDTFTSANEALSGINYLKPDCVFLDIEMPEMNGFALLRQLQYRDFAVVITTAYSQYAIQAIKESALDYLLKPIDSDEIGMVVDKLKKLNTPENLQEQFLQTLAALSRADSPKMVQIPVNGKVLFIRVEDIVYCESDGNYSKIFLESDKEVYTSRKLKDLGLLLPKDYFFRIHNSYIVHTLKVVEYLRTEGYVVLCNNKKIPVSRNKKEEFLIKMSY
ncbi:response regulator transcription factor [Maribacter sp. MMG018]|uniref:LytR/AlgR family response regulator transcription factor n=1 Tax=Maribacter sp. MMG018 TaxID=2822688 RepID=UPI001B389BCA|nr:LytTR family DNA-binding domain-containing protein [Maribacter sp. MMG018]MBQ4913858.1 response regulator transcription factor [Maribacter sp. MMG018]